MSFRLNRYDRKPPHFLHSIITVITWYCVLVAVRVTSVSSARQDVTYSELQHMKADCYPLDSCRENRSAESLGQFNCLCGPYCKAFDSCCLDSKYRASTIPTVKHKCVEVPMNYTYTYMVDTCKRNWVGEEYISDLCAADGKALSDPMLLIPVTNPKTGTTYKNYFCAACHNENQDDVVFWNAKITRYDSDIHLSVLPTLKYDKDTMNWSIKDSNGKIDFVLFHLHTPDYLVKHVMQCRGSSVISSCAGNWRNHVIRKKCFAYTALVNVGYDIYKNVHCAICNFRNITDKECMKVYPSGSGAGGRKPLSFALLLDVNRSDGDRVGEVERCASNEKYDPFFQKCRTLKCALPSQTLKDGKCARI